MELNGNINYFQCEHGLIFPNNGKFEEIVMIFQDYMIPFDNKFLLMGDEPKCKCEEGRKNFLSKNLSNSWLSQTKYTFAK